MNNICFNERQNLWTTRYDWAPTISENINGTFYSIGGLDEESNNSIWKHSVNEFDENSSNPTNSTKWYGKQHRFEFEFVVSDPIGVNKIFDNLQIVSNNTQPDSMEISIIGDDYMFKRQLTTAEDVEECRREYDHNSETTSDIHYAKSGDTKTYPDYCMYKTDERLNQTILKKFQQFKDIYKYGRRLGNIQYKNGVWYSQIEPIRINNISLSERDARIRDKWARIRIIYNGENPVIIAAIRTLINI